MFQMPQQDIAEVDGQALILETKKHDLYFYFALAEGKLQFDICI